MEALEATSTAAEVDPDLISKIGARYTTRNRRAPPPVPTAMVGADFRIMTKCSLDKWYTSTVIPLYKYSYEIYSCGLCTGYGFTGSGTDRY